MDDKEGLENDLGKSVESGPPPEVAARLEPTPAGPVTAQQLADVEKQMSSYEKATLRWAKLAVIMSALAAFFVCLQWVEMRSGSRDTKKLAEAAKETADTERQVTIGQNAAVIYPMIDFDANGFLNVGLVNRGKVLATDGSVEGTTVEVSLRSLKEIGQRQHFSYKFPAIRLDDASNKSQTIRNYGKSDFEDFVSGKVGFKIDLSWQYNDGFDAAPKSDSACYIRLQMANAPNNLPCDSARSHFLSLLPPDQRWDKAHAQNPN